jgi:hypothetical protein
MYIGGMKFGGSTDLGSFVNAFFGKGHWTIKVTAKVDNSRVKISAEIATT